MTARMRYAQSSDRHSYLDMTRTSTGSKGPVFNCSILLPILQDSARRLDVCQRNAALPETSSISLRQCTEEMLEISLRRDAIEPDRGEACGFETGMSANNALLEVT